MLRCAILDDYQNAALSMADWSPLAETVAVTPIQEHLTGEALLAAIRDCDILVIMRERTPLTAALFAALPRLKLLITSGMRNASIDLAAAARHGVTVCGTASSSTPPTELTWALILGLARKLVPESVALKTNGAWQSSVGFDLAGRRLGLLGLGKIGAQVAKVGLAFGMEVTAWSQNLTEERAASMGVARASSKEELLSSSDIVSVHLVLSDRTRGLIAAPEIKLMRATAYLINTSRAPIIDQAALAEALQAGTIAGAGLDVFEEEPLPPDSVWRRLENVLATPHLGYVSEVNYRTYFRETVEDIQAFLSGHPIRELQATAGTP